MRLFVLPDTLINTGERCTFLTGPFDLQLIAPIRLSVPVAIVRPLSPDPSAAVVKPLSPDPSAAKVTPS